VPQLKLDRNRTTCTSHRKSALKTQYFHTISEKRSKNSQISATYVTALNMFVSYSISNFWHKSNLKYNIFNDTFKLRLACYNGREGVFEMINRNDEFLKWWMKWWIYQHFVSIDTSKYRRLVPFKRLNSLLESLKFICMCRFTPIFGHVSLD